MSSMWIILAPVLSYAEKEKPVGIYGQWYLWYLKKYRNALLFCKSVPFQAVLWKKISNRFHIR